MTPFGQRLLVARDRDRAAVAVGGLVVLDALALDRLAVDVEHAVAHLDLVARQADHALDVVGRLSRGSLKTTTSPRFGSRAEDAAREERRAEGERVAAVAVGKLRDEQIVADQQRRLHRARGDVEGLEEEGAHDQRDQQRLDDDLDRLPSRLSFAFLALCRSSCSLRSTLMPPAML